MAGYLLEFVEVNSGVVAHDRDGGHFLKSDIVSSLNLNN